MKNEKNINKTKIIMDEKDEILKIINLLPVKNVSEEKLDFIRKEMEMADIELGNANPFYNVLHRIRMITKDRRRFNAENPSGYYKIKANIIHEELDGYVTFHRGKGLPNLFEDKGINKLIFPEDTRMEIEESNEFIYAQSILYDIFTQEEVGDIIKNIYPSVMNISIEPVSANSIDDYFSACCGAYDGSPKHNAQTMIESAKNDNYFLSIRWTNESLVA